MMLGLGIKAAAIGWRFLSGNWTWALPLAGMIALGAWGGWQYLGKIEAEAALADQKLQIIEDANQTWGELERKRRAFEEEVKAGLTKLTEKVEAVHAANGEFQKRVDANANSTRALDPVERGALRLLDIPPGADRDKAGGGAIRPSDQPPRVRR